MVADCGLGEAEERLDVAGANADACRAAVGRGVGQEPEDLEAGGVAQEPEPVRHGRHDIDANRCECRLSMPGGATRSARDGREVDRLGSRDPDIDRLDIDSRLYVI